MGFNNVALPIHSKIRGVTFDGRQEVCGQLYAGARLSLVREPHNSYDPKAIGVFFEEERCGFIPADLASQVAVPMDEGLALEAVVTGVTGGGDLYIGVNIRIQETAESGLGEGSGSDIFSEDPSDWVSDEDKPASREEQLDDQFELTKEQRRVVGYDIHRNSVLKVIAFAGTGKTATLLEYAKARPHMRFLYMAFNRSMREEAQRKFPSNVTCHTTHSLAFRRFGRPHQPRLIKGLKLNSVKSALRLNTFREAHVVFETFESFLRSADRKVHTRHLPYMSKRDPQKLSFYLSKAAELWVTMCHAKSDQIGMLHDCYLKQYQLWGPKLDYDCILLDEAQDTNPVVANIFLSQDCPRILVGDPHQQIYAWRGARDAMESIDAEKDFYLTGTFRFGSEIAWIANKILGTFKWETEKIEGKRSEGKKDDRQEYAIIARTNAVVFDKATGLCLTHKIAFLGGIEGYRFDDIRDVYFLYAGKIAEIKNKYIRDFETYRALEAYAEETDDRELKSRCKVVEKYTDTIPNWVERIEASTVDRPQADVILTTAHKSKGDQFSKVRLCSDFPELFQDGELISPTELGPDEANLLYVAVTRAKEVLQFSAYWDWQKFLSFDRQPGYERVLEFLQLNDGESSGEDEPAAAEEAKCPPREDGRDTEERAGLLTCEDGSRYEGQMKGDTPHGYGTMTYSDGTIYEGRWQEGKMHGMGSLTRSNGYNCEGEFREGELLNPVTVTYPNGSKYEGELKEDLPHGRGTMTHFR